MADVCNVHATYPDIFRRRARFAEPFLRVKHRMFLGKNKSPDVSTIVHCPSGKPSLAYNRK